jgi:hypothetical protein
MKLHLTILSLVLIASAGIYGCSNPQAPQAQSQTPTSEPATQATAELGTLQIRANGEDFIRQGFTSKDGWKVSFDHVYVTLGSVTAYQADPPYDPKAQDKPNAQETVRLDQTQTVDLAVGDENAEPILIGEVKAPPGRYNALSWKMVKATDGPASGVPLMLKGKATKEGQTIDFNLKLDREMSFSCGDFVGDQRKGLLKSAGIADLEATFHFDHLFGDAGTPMSDDLNQGALGFQPLAVIAQAGKLEADMATLEKRLSAADFKKLQSILPSLGHVGEGHCQQTSA